MQPINNIERRKAFWNFLLLFLVCILIILTMGFFSVRVPFEENENLRHKLSQIDKERTLTKEFSAKMIEVSRMLDTIDRASPEQAELLDGRITEDILRLNSMASDTLFNSELYKNIVRNLGILQQNSKKMRKVADSDSELNKFKSELQRANEKAQDNYTKYIECLTKK